MKRKEPSRETIQLPYLRIEVSELLEILERVSDGNNHVSAETDTVEFENIEEMKRHKSKLADRLTIKIGDVQFEAYVNSLPPMLSVHLGRARRDAENANAADQAKTLMEALRLELLQYKCLVASPFSRIIISSVFAFICVAAAIVFKGMEMTLSNFLILAAAFFLCSKVFDVVLLKAVGESTVYYKPRETWIQRHQGEIIAAVLAAVISGSIGALITFYLSN